MSAENFPVIVEVLASAAIFVGVWVILSRTFFKPFFEVLEEREARTQGDEGAAKDRRRESVEMAERVEQALNQARINGIRQREEFVGTAKLKAEQITEEAQKRAQIKLETAREEIEAQKIQARAGLPDQAKRLGEMVVERVLSEENSQTVH